MGASLPKPVTCTVLERQNGRDFRVGLAEMNGWRASMEDAHVVHLGQAEGFFGILDGHGGAECSAWCAKRLHEKLAAEGCPQNDAAAKKLVLDVDQEYLSQEIPSGSTAAMTVVRPPAQGKGKYKVHVINAGDSRVLLSDGYGNIIDGGGTDGGLSTDHKPDHPSERERIERCGGTVEFPGGVPRVNGDLAVSRGFGDAEYKRTGGPSPEDRPVTANPEMGHFECSASDFLLLVCDGVSEGDFPNAEVCELAAEVLRETGGDAAKAAEAVIFRAIERNSKDNISCMIVLLGGGAGGGGTARPGTVVEFVPGSLIHLDDSTYRKAYVAMCERGGVHLGEAVDQRHAMLTARAGTAAEEATDAEELATLWMPPPVATGGDAQRKGWCMEWAMRCDGAEARDDDVDVDVDDVEEDGFGGRGYQPIGGHGGAASQQEQLLMQMLYQQMRNNGEPPAGAAADAASSVGRRSTAGSGSPQVVEMKRQEAKLKEDIADLEERLHRARQR